MKLREHHFLTLQSHTIQSSIILIFATSLLPISNSNVDVVSSLTNLLMVWVSDCGDNSHTHDHARYQQHPTKLSQFPG